MPGHRKMISTTTEPSTRMPSIRPITVIVGIKRVAAGVPSYDDPLRQPLGPGRVDVVLAQLLDQGRPHHPGDDRRSGVAQDDRRQDHVPDRVPERRAAAGQDGVDRVEARRVRRCSTRSPSSERPTGNQPRPAQKKISITMPNQNVGMLAPLTARTRVTWSGQRSRRRAANVPIETPSAIAIRPATSGQLDGRRQLLHEHVGHRCVRHRRPAELALEDPLQPGEVLHGQRLVQPEPLLDALAPRRGSSPVRCRHRSGEPPTRIRAKTMTVVTRTRNGRIISRRRT